MVDSPAPLLSRAEILALFATVDAREVEAAFAAAEARLGVAASGYDRTETLRLLEEMSRTPGVIGVVSSFARARVLLKSSASPAPRR